jgi:hypothetical protein
VLEQLSIDNRLASQALCLETDRSSALEAPYGTHDGCLPDALRQPLYLVFILSCFYQIVPGLRRPRLDETTSVLIPVRVD